jgi:hypothetical protein
MVLKKIKAFRYALAVMLMLSFVNPGYGQTGIREEIESLLNNKMSAIREERPSGPTSSAAIAEKYGVKLLPYLEQYRNDASERVRWHAYALLWFVGKNSDSMPDRQKIVEVLAEGIAKSSPGSVSRWWLFSFRSKDFSDASKSLIHKMLMAKKPKPDVILLCGVADMKSELPRLKEFLIDESDYKGPMRDIGRNWAARRARARMGVKEDIKRCIEFVEAYPDEERRVTFLLKDISYVRQPDVVEYLRKYLDSDKEILVGGCVGTISYAGYAARALAKMLPGFPGSDDQVAYSKEKIVHFREWMSKQKEWNLLQ